MARSKSATEIDTINQKLKAAGVRLRVVVRNHKLNLRGTLPPRPGSTETKPKQTYLALGLDATTYGYKMALSEALKVWAALDQNKFDWNDYIDTTNWQSCQAWIERYKKHWFQSKGNSLQDLPPLYDLIEGKLGASQFCKNKSTIKQLKVVVEVSKRDV